MTQPVPVFTWAPLLGVSGTTKFDVLVAQFGDGYSQRAPNGINNAADVWSLTFRNDDAVIDAIHAFLKSTRGAQRFEWTPPRRAKGMFVCDPQGITRQIEGAGISTLTATFQEVF
ncbi:phage tail protein [Burkholderia ubonensis]|uniref:Phage tail protein n=1 Tax=Burkholderia ubonensis TaxID=101571 RepID=A0A103RZG8_9BURK|nr:phage tail protein [Burkholderia ubonensis]AOJ66465.1 phage tail protein [Burkholderia ubonensis]KVG76886.1 phage tail protein [Burkholderia ubonensis]